MTPKKTVDENWRKWVRTLSGSTNPKDTDLLITKIEILLLAERQQADQEKIAYARKIIEEAMPKEVYEDDAYDDYANGWNACRAEMERKGEEVINQQTIL